MNNFNLKQCCHCKWFQSHSDHWRAYNIEYEYVKGLGPRGPDAPRPYKLALCAPCLIKGAPKHY